MREKNVLPCDFYEGFFELDKKRGCVKLGGFVKQNEVCTVKGG